MEQSYNNTLCGCFALDMTRLLNPAERSKSDELAKACRNVFEADNCSNRKLEKVGNQSEQNNIDHDCNWNQ